MLKELRRQDRALAIEDTEVLLQRGKFGVLSVRGENGYPYGVPIHYVLMEKALYFHCSSTEGHMVPALRAHQKVCFTVIETKDGIKSQSAVFFGRAKEVPEKKQLVMEKLVEKFVPKCAWEPALQGIPTALAGLLVFEVTIDQLSGKWIDQPKGR